MRKVILVVLALITQLLGCSTPSQIAVPHVYQPPQPGSYPGVIILHTSAGLYSHETDYAQMLTRQGYVTAVVDYFAEGGVDNISKAYDVLRKNPQTAGQKIGVVGFSRGAFSVLDQIAAWGNSRPVSAIVAYYVGPKLNMTDSKLPPILFLHGDQDNHVDPKQIQLFCKAQKSLGGICEVEIYQDGRHAFDHPLARMGAYNEEITKRANIKALDFLNQYLKNTP